MTRQDTESEDSMTTTKRAPARSPQQIAQDKVDKAQAKVDAFTARIALHKSELEKAERHLKAAQGDLAYAKANPRLADAAQMTIPLDGTVSMNDDES